MLNKYVKTCLVMMPLLGLSACTTLGPDFQTLEAKNLPDSWKNSASDSESDSESELKQTMQASPHTMILP
ncbi:hypothetical protein [Shewanella benthica]|uniref:Lipoprotein n=1 Tax=Shewanella benthica KT99 TaxID=314608 RepID=A9D0M9_9GAMM|nr:hypothetical protein [Shewanella benthica]EDQ02141.1 hypothetical protein KT99_20114 [Shewanella benthica KT99]